MLATPSRPPPSAAAPPRRPGSGPQAAGPPPPRAAGLHACASCCQGGGRRGRGSCSSAGRGRQGGKLLLGAAGQQARLGKLLLGAAGQARLAMRQRGPPGQAPDVLVRLMLPEVRNDGGRFGVAVKLLDGDLGCIGRPPTRNLDAVSSQRLCERLLVKPFPAQRGPALGKRGDQSRACVAVGRATAPTVGMAALFRARTGMAPCLPRLQ